MTPRPPALLAWSGGKDAAWALHVLRQRREVDVVGLLSTINADDERASMQGIRVDVLRAQAAAAGLPLLEMRIPERCDNACYEAALAATLAEAQARWPGITRIAFGDLLLADIRAWREALCAGLGWTALFPLFGANTAALAREMVTGGLRAQLCCIDTTQLDASFSGRDFDAVLLDALPPTVDRCGENGEFHTCVSAGPMFTAPLALARGDPALRDGRFAVTDYRLGD
ncbi:ATP-binding protein [Luteimonas sp. MC1572]|uniref:Dph6-related ATP pyrophosphatase n=1 Tax=Luteimonas sp. MC1572 TaxID=2799325 RepID=UPI0018F10241|nr:ATP-binding protein [Luteimonas sp. MC1572]MBJ6982183.1 ATP-binding protein [Luteimonas sp. MC1572]QQO03465.1 ATP-binding protein [Luteimonas sp. MC1572]